MKNSGVFVYGAEKEAKTVAAGVTRKVLAYSEAMMVCEIRLEKGALLPMHSHVHEQSTNIITGKLSYTVGAETKTVGAGDSVMIGADVPHEITALEDTFVIDVFTPMRADFL